MPEIKAVVFDMDGTILNTELLYPRVSEEILKRRGFELSQELTDAMMGRPAPVAFKVMIDWHQLDDTIDTLAGESEAIFGQILEDSLGLMPGFIELFAHLVGNNVPTAVCTSASRKTAIDLLDRFDILPELQFVIGGDEVEQGKPNPEIYHSAAGRLGLTTEEIAVFEDSATGCQAAVSAGTYAIAVPGDHSRRHAFDGSKLIADTLSDPRIYDLLGF